MLTNPRGPHPPVYLAAALRIGENDSRALHPVEPE
jgi:hypothetical protein